MTLDTPTYSLQQGQLPLLISIPHLGTELPAARQPWAASRA